MDRWIEWHGGPLFLRQPSDGEGEADERDDDSEEASVADMKSDMAELRREIDRQISGRFSKEKRAMLKEIDELKQQLAEAQRVEASKQESSDDSDDTDMSPGMKAQMARLQKQLDSLQTQNDDLARAAQEKEQQMKLERRQHTIEQELTNLNAVRPDQAYRIIQDMIVEDDEIGDAIPVKTDHGDDLVPVKDYLTTFKEDNPHLFAASAKSGSGAGGGAAGSMRKRWSKDSLVDPKAGGMDWSQYEKNRDAIHRDLEESAGN